MHTECSGQAAMTYKQFMNTVAFIRKQTFKARLNRGVHKSQIYFRLTQNIREAKGLRSLIRFSRFQIEGVYCKQTKNTKQSQKIVFSIF